MGGCGGCEQIEHKPVTLADGRTVCSSCEDWRMECEVKKILAMPNPSERRDWMDAMEKKRGKPAVDLLRNAVRAEWSRRKAAA